VLASPGVCKKRLLKAELCFVARIVAGLDTIVFVFDLCGIRITIYSSDGICEV